MQAYDEESSKQLIELLYLMPQGMYHHSMEIPGLVTASTNIGSIAMDGDTAVITSAIRSPLDGYRNDIALQIKTIASLLDAASEDMADYPGWSYEKDSPLRKLYNEVIEEKLGKTLEERASHGGLEAGVLKGLLPELDIITLGPIASGAHTPDEQLNIASFERMYEVLTYLLTKL